MRSVVRPALKAVVIVAYFATTTAWLPSVVLKSDLLVGTDRLVGDMAGVGVWAAFFGAGIVMLRIAQLRGWI